MISWSAGALHFYHIANVYMANYFSVESCDGNCTGSMIAVAVLAVLFILSLICCLGLIVIVFRQHRTNILLQEKIK